MGCKVSSKGAFDTLTPCSQERDLTWQSRRAPVKMRSLEKVQLLYGWRPREGGDSDTDADMHREKTRAKGDRQPCEVEGRGQGDTSTTQGGVPKAVGQRSLSAQGLAGPVCIHGSRVDIGALRLPAPQIGYKETLLTEPPSCDMLSQQPGKNSRRKFRVPRMCSERVV